VLPKVSAYKHEVTHGGPSALSLTEDEFDLDRKALALA